MNRLQIGSWLAAAFVTTWLSPAARAQTYTIATVAGDGIQGFSGDNGSALKAELWAFSGLTVDAAGNILIADTGNCRIRKVSAGIITTIAGSGLCGLDGDGGPATSAQLNYPRAVAVDAAGSIYIADTGNNVIRKVTPAGIITTIAGDGNQGFSGDGGPALKAEMFSPWSLAFDSHSQLYFVDRSNQRVRKVAADGTISTVAGTGLNQYLGDGGPAAAASLYVPDSVAFDGADNMYIVEAISCVVRKVDAKGIIHTLAGAGTFGFGGDGGPATSALMNDPQSVAADAAGNVYIADEDNHRIRLVTPDGKITTITGTGTPGFSGDGGTSIGAAVNLPEGVAIGPGGVVYFVDSGNRRIRTLTPPPSIRTGGVVSASDFGGFPTIAPGSWIEIYGTAFTSTTRLWAGADFNGSAAPTNLSGVTVTVGGKPAFIDFISPAQINAQVPSGVPAGTQPVVVTGPNGPTLAYSATVAAAQPGLLAPGAFQLGGVAYAAAVFSDGFFALPPGAIPQLASRRAKAGDTLTLYGIGFGAVTPDTPAGQIAAGATMLAAPFQFKFGQTAAIVTYMGLTPGSVGLYQFNVVVPPVPSNDATPITFSLNGVAGTQTLFLPVQ